MAREPRVVIGPRPSRRRPAPRKGLSTGQKVGVAAAVLAAAYVTALAVTPRGNLGINIGY